MKSLRSDLSPKLAPIRVIQVDVVSCALTTRSESVDPPIGTMGEIVVSKVFESVLDVLFRVGGLAGFEQH